MLKAPRIRTWMDRVDVRRERIHYAYFTLPAKKLNMDPVEISVPVTKPRLRDDTKELAIVAKKQTANDLKRLMHISDDLAAMNYERFQAFNLESRSNSAKPAGLAFDGDVYWGLEADSLSETALAYAQDHLRIISGLYGVLRPMDAIQPYRLEMGTKMANGRGKSLYDFWGSRIAERLKTDISRHSDKTIVNLASNEYFKAVDTNALGRPVIGAKFLNVKDGKARSLMYYAQACARQYGALDYGKPGGPGRRIKKDFNVGGYSLEKNASTDQELVFSRPQPATKK